MVDRVEPERDDTRRRDFFSKMDFTLESVVAHLEKKAKLSDEVAQHVTDGTVLLQGWLTDTKPETLEQLKELGFELVAQPKMGQLVIRRLSVEKLKAFSKFSVVRYVTLQRAGT